MAADTTIANRITVGLIKQSDDALTYLTEATGHSKTDVVNRALQLYRFVAEAERRGAVVLLRDEAGNTERVHFL